ncbi:Hypothetical protein SCLAV_2430 [Streptomyces clavuligerus]|uniref:Uncharacterized protein n=1 Tax=Streptomyces clavuligerus TaxID=1901 RepID=B5GPD5_STRCL|nr:hypothetical protein SSCG_01462 [Streptomyces clavuligerus]EFG07503.1 Hypothetical protein SCLAV_2430 [Streptomyces clavuligerus]
MGPGASFIGTEGFDVDAPARMASFRAMGGGRCPRSLRYPIRH